MICLEGTFLLVCRNSSQILTTKLFTFFKAFHSVNFLLTNSQLVHSLVLFTVLSGWVPFLVFFTVLSGLEDFFLSKLPPVNNFDKSKKIPNGLPTVHVPWAGAAAAPLIPPEARSIGSRSTNGLPAVRALERAKKLHDHIRQVQQTHPLNGSIM